MSAGGKYITNILLGISGSCRKAVKMEPPLQQRNYNGQRSASQTAVPTLKVMRLQSPSMVSEKISMSVQYFEIFHHFCYLWPASISTRETPRSIIYRALLAPCACF